jgi:hypothetical protein
MKTVLLALIIGGAIFGALIIRHGRSDEGARRAVADDDVEALRQEVKALRSRVSSAEAVGAAALTAAADGQKAAPAPAKEPEAASDEGKTPPFSQRVPVEAEQVATFHRYFDQIDSLRGAVPDEVAANKFRAVLAKHEWNAVGGAAPAAAAVACGNSYCRVSLKFDQLKDASAARSNLLLDFGTAFSAATMFLDPKTLELETYFTTDGKPLPPFPTSSASAEPS